MYRVQTKFIGSCSSEQNFESFEAANAYVEHEIETMQCYHRAAHMRPNFMFTVYRSPSMNGNLIIQVMIPEDRKYRTRPNLLVIFRIIGPDTGEIRKLEDEGAGAAFNKFMMETATAILWD